MDAIPVVCGLIFKERQILVCRKGPGKVLSGYWEFPGGKIEIGETAETALIRELFEELGMSVTVGKHFKTVHHRYSTATIELAGYLCQFMSASFQLTEHDLYEWMDVADLHKKQWAPADIPIVDQLQSEFYGF